MSAAMASSNSVSSSSVPVTNGHPNPIHTTTSVTTATGNVLTTVTTETVTSVTTTPLNITHDLLTVARRLDEKVSGWLAQEARTPLAKRVQAQTRISLAVISEALERYKFDELAMSFNGGKDCLVLLILYLVGIAQKFSNNNNSTTNPSPSPSLSSSSSSSPAQADKHTPPPEPQTIPSVYVMSTHPFAEVDEFVDKCISDYHLQLSRFPVPMKSAFQTYLDQHPQVKAIFVGTRRTDPHGEKLTFFDRTDHGWPDFMRVHPVIDWHYVEIWAFLRELDIPYCCLYDQGYTSLGGTTDTHPNPALEVETKGDEKHFRPAYELMDDDEERLGRDR